MTKRSRLGRPPKVAPEDIAKAALDIGLERADVRGVADALGMSAAGVYHYVRTREELIELAAEYALREMLQQAPEAGSFADLLTFFAREFYELYASHPQLLSDIYSGRMIVTFKMLPHFERLIARGVAGGFTPGEAYEIFVRVMGGVIGAAVLEAGSRELGRKGSSFPAEIAAGLGGDASAAPHLQAVVSTGSLGELDSFENVLLLLQGLISKFGSRLSDIDVAGAER